MPESPLELLRKGQVANLPWMTGLTSEEGTFVNHFISRTIWPLICYICIKGHGIFHLCMEKTAWNI